MRKRLLEIAGFLALTVAVTGLWAAGARTPHDSKRGVEPRMNRPGDAETGPSLSIEEIAGQADLIAVGRCTETRSQWVGRNLFTLATVSVGEVVKGEQRSSLTVALPGGVDAKRQFPVAVSYAGAPTMTPGEEVVLFLTGEGRIPHAYDVVGYSQGKLTVVRDEAGRKTVSRGARSITLSEFESRIRSYLRR
jgi:hypothetical protein